MSVNKEVMDRIRAQFIDSVQKNSELFHRSDVERVESNDWWIERFVLTTKSEEAALKALIKAMQWRKTFGVNDFNDDYFPEEFYKLPSVIVKRDRNNRPILWFVCKYNCKVPEFTVLVKQYLVYLLERVDRQTTHEGWAMACDLNGCGLSNVDMDMAYFGIDVVQHYYPKGAKYYLAVDLPWILNAIAKLVIRFMNEEIRQSVKFITKAEIGDYFDCEYLPAHLGGTGNKNLFVIPEGVKPLEQLSHFNYTSDQIKRFYLTFKLK